MKMWKAFAAAGSLSLAAALPAAAATLIVSGGILTGASGVTVATAAGTKTYNVEFLDGSCVTLFSNCAADPSLSSLPPFAFTTEQDALAASQALLDHVFIDGFLGPFNSEPGLTRGCSFDPSTSNQFCQMYTPFTVAPDGLSVAFALNFSPPSGRDDGAFTDLTTPTFDTTLPPYLTYARWSEVTPIPLPAGAPLLLAGIMALAGLKWRKRRERRRAQV